MDDDVDIELAPVYVEPPRGERADRGPPPVGQEEFVAVPRGHDELVRTGGRYATLHRLQAGIHELA